MSWLNKVAKEIYNKNISDGSYGIELIIDLHDCDNTLFTKEALSSFLQRLLEITDMEAQGQPIFWEEKNTKELHLKGTSVFQFIKTSNIVIHTLDSTDLVLINLFTCKDFDIDRTVKFAKSFFGSKEMNYYIVQRGER